MSSEAKTIWVLIKLIFFKPQTIASGQLFISLRRKRCEDRRNALEHLQQQNSYDKMYGHIEQHIQN